MTKAWQWMSRDETVAVKRLKVDMNRGKIPQMSDRQLGIVVARFRKDNIQPSRFAILRAGQKNLRGPKRKKPGPKSKFEWCFSWLVRTALRKLGKKSNPWPVTSYSLREDLREHRRRRIGSGHHASTMPMPTARMIRHHLNRKEIYTFDPENFHEFTALEKRKRVNFCKRVLRSSWRKKIDLYLDEKSWIIRRSPAYRIMAQRTKHTKVYAKAKPKNAKVRKNAGRVPVNKSSVIRLCLKKNKKNICSKQVIAGIEPKSNRKGPAVSMWMRARDNKLNTKTVKEALVKWATKYRKARRWGPKRTVRVVLDNAKYHQQLLRSRLSGHHIQLLYLPPHSADLAICDYVGHIKFFNNLKSPPNPKPPEPNFFIILISILFSIRRSGPKLN